MVSISSGGGGGEGGEGVSIRQYSGQEKRGVRGGVANYKRKIRKNTRI